MIGFMSSKKSLSIPSDTPLGNSKSQHLLKMRKISLISTRLIEFEKTQRPDTDTSLKFSILKRANRSSTENGLRS